MMIIPDMVPLQGNQLILIFETHHLLSPIHSSTTIGGEPLYPQDQVESPQIQHIGTDLNNVLANSDW